MSRLDPPGEEALPRRSGAGRIEARAGEDPSGQLLQGLGRVLVSGDSGPQTVLDTQGAEPQVAGQRAQGQRNPAGSPGGPRSFLRTNMSRVALLPRPHPCSSLRQLPPRLPSHLWLLATGRVSLPACRTPCTPLPSSLHMTLEGRSSPLSRSLLCSGPSHRFRIRAKALTKASRPYTIQLLLAFDCVSYRSFPVSALQPHGLLGGPCLVRDAFASEPLLCSSLCPGGCSLIPSSPPTHCSCFYQRPLSQ